jgi:hypothetical protein
VGGQAGPDHAQQEKNGADRGGPKVTHGRPGWGSVAKDGAQAQQKEENFKRNYE